MNFKLCCAALVLGVAFVTSSAQALIPVQPTVMFGPLSNPANGQTYEVIGGFGGSTLNWSNAEINAELLGGHLATIDSAAENAWIVSNILVNVVLPGTTDNLSLNPLWIGLSDPSQDLSGGTHASNFVWVNGDPSTYRNWNTSTGEPTDTGGNEFYAAINWHYAQNGNDPPGTWNDVPLNGSVGYGGNSDGPYFALIEIAPEPASLGILTLAAGTMLLRRRR